jgi:hypothetical protein
MSTCSIHNDTLLIESKQFNHGFKYIPLESRYIHKINENVFVLSNSAELIEATVLFGLNEIFFNLNTVSIMCKKNEHVVSEIQRLYANEKSMLN